jgi:SAM-dependent methyltransferase
MMYETRIKQQYWTARWSLGWRLSRWGERVGVDALTYNPVVFQHFGQVASEAAPVFVDVVRDFFPAARRVVDVGCGTGHFVRAFRDAGFAADGLEHSRHARQYARKHLGLRLEPLDLRHAVRPTAGRADLGISIEVAEHLPPAMGDRLVQLLCETASAVLFTAAQPGQGGTGHVNEQPLEYWQACFERHGFRHDRDASLQFRMSYRDRTSSAPWIGRNALVFREGMRRAI